ncbi:MAG: hypothetical protein LBR76_03685, partial [Oscillospiraceae bacterium]|nr:hypothetical protein [Oscillospiraceae bacterium]
QAAYGEVGEKRSHPYKEKGNKYTHGERVAALAVRLRQLLFPDDTGFDGILTAAAWLHDIRNGAEDHAALGAARARELLAPYCSGEETEQICGIIAVHDARKPGDASVPDIVKLHQDADHLDHFGTFDIWALAMYTIGNNQTINDALEYLQGGWHKDNAHWRTVLHFGLSRRIFDDKTAFVKQFTERFAAECAGGIWHEAALLQAAPQG